MLTAAIFVSALLYLWAATRGERAVVYVLKPGIMVLILILASSGVAASPEPGYVRTIIVGLLCSTAGDIFLMLPRERFVAGLGSFLLAHLCYIWALWVYGGGFTGAEAVVAVLLFGVALWFYRHLAEGIRERGRAELIGPVGLYIFVISLMVWRATGTLFAPGAQPFQPGWVALGAVLFYISDAALAWDKFVRPLAHRHLIVMGCYFAAQYCFAVSVFV